MQGAESKIRKLSKKQIVASTPRIHIRDKHKYRGREHNSVIIARLSLMTKSLGGSQSHGSLCSQKSLPYNCMASSSGLWRYRHERKSEPNFSIVGGYYRSK